MNTSLTQLLTYAKPPQRCYRHSKYQCARLLMVHKYLYFFHDQGADPGFLIFGGTNLEQGHFLVKTCENNRIGYDEGWSERLKWWWWRAHNTTAPPCQMHQWYQIFFTNVNFLNIAHKWQKSAGDDESTLALKLMGRVIQSLKWGVPVVPTKKKKKTLKKCQLSGWNIFCQIYL